MVEGLEQLQLAKTGQKRQPKKGQWYLPGLSSQKKHAVSVVIL